MTFRGHDGFTDDVREIGANGEIPIEPDGAQSRPGNEAAAHAEKTAENSDDESGRGEINRADVRAGNWEMHHSVRPLSKRSRSEESHSSTTAWPMIRTIEIT